MGSLQGLVGYDGTLRGSLMSSTEGKAAAMLPCIINHCHIPCSTAVQGLGMTALATAAFTFPAEHEN